MAKSNEFHAFTVKHSGRAHRVVTEVGLSKPFAPTSPSSQTVSIYTTRALWDTGATKSVITQATVSALGLIPVGVGLVQHAGGSDHRSNYLINVILPNNVTVGGVLASECPDIVGDFGAIVGMDIISQGDLSLTNLDGVTWMSFRIPSLHRIDYVVEANKLMYGQAQRNDPCPCGKIGDDGKPLKFKFCHGKDLSFLRSPSA